MELVYCTQHERVYDATEGQWIPFLRGDVRLVQTMVQSSGTLHVKEDVCDLCLWLCHSLLVQQREERYASLPPRPFNPAWN
jgi:hypothetical protein